MKLVMVAALAVLGLSSNPALAQTAPPGGGSNGGASMQVVPRNRMPLEMDYRTRMDRGSIDSDRYLASGNPLEIREAFAAAKLAGVECAQKDAALVNRKGKVLTYEVACDKDFGWIVSSKDAGKTFTAYECLALETSSKTNKGGLATCRLAANVGAHAGIDALAVKAGLRCPAVAKYAYLGSGGTPPISRYELACGADNYLVDTPTPGSKASLQVIPCKDVAGVCTLNR